MQRQCRVCGKSLTIDEWSQDYDKLKVSDDRAYICPACQERIRIEAQKEQQR